MALLYDIIVINILTNDWLTMIDRYQWPTLIPHTPVQAGGLYTTIWNDTVYAITSSPGNVMTS